MRKSMDTAGAAEWSIDMADCKKVQKMIGKFDHGQLDIKQEEFFIQHVESCKDCREEFEIYYIVAYGLSEIRLSWLNLIRSWWNSMILKDWLN